MLEACGTFGKLALEVARGPFTEEKNQMNDPSLWSSHLVDVGSVAHSGDDDLEHISAEREQRNLEHMRAKQEEDKRCVKKARLEETRRQLQEDGSKADIQKLLAGRLALSRNNHS